MIRTIILARSQTELFTVEPDFFHGDRQATGKTTLLKALDRILSEAHPRDVLRKAADICRTHLRDLKAIEGVNAERLAKITGLKASQIHMVFRDRRAPIQQRVKEGRA